MARCTTGCSSCLSAAEYSCCSLRELLECIAVCLMCYSRVHATSVATSALTALNSLKVPSRVLNACCYYTDSHFALQR
eukprot:10897-Heterococcus_DN1.PRE.4